MAIFVEKNQGIRLPLASAVPTPLHQSREVGGYYKVRSYHGGGEFFQQENAQLILQCLGEFLPRAVERPGPDGRMEIFYQHLINGQDVCSCSAPLDSGVQVPADEVKRLEEAIASLKAKENDPGTDPTKREIIRAFRLPNPQKDPELYRLHSIGSQKRLLVLWGVEKEAGSSLPPLAAVQQVPQSARSFSWWPWMALPLLLLALILWWWVSKDNDSRIVIVPLGQSSSGVAVPYASDTPPTDTRQSGASLSERSGASGTGASGTSQPATLALATPSGQTPPGMGVPAATLNDSHSSPPKDGGAAAALAGSNAGKAPSTPTGSSPSGNTAASDTPGVGSKSSSGSIPSKQSQLGEISDPTAAVTSPKGTGEPSTTPLAAPESSNERKPVAQPPLTLPPSAPQTPTDRMGTLSGSPSTEASNSGPDANKTGGSVVPSSTSPVAGSNLLSPSSLSPPATLATPSAPTGASRPAELPLAKGPESPSPSSPQGLASNMESAPGSFSNKPPIDGSSTGSGTPSTPPSALATEILNARTAAAPKNGKVEMQLSALVRDQNGDPVTISNIKAWTVDGSVQRDERGNLLTANGLPVRLSKGRHLVQVEGTAFDGRPIKANAEVMVDIAVREESTVEVRQVGN